MCRLYFGLEILKTIINEENINKVKDFFCKLGIVSKIKDGYYYPYSNQASSIREIFITNLKNKKVITLDITSMVAGAKYRGDFEERIKAVIDEVIKSDDIILFIDSSSGSE